MSDDLVQVVTHVFRVVEQQVSAALDVAATEEASPILQLKWTGSYRPLRTYLDGNRHVITGSMVADSQLSVHLRDRHFYTTEGISRLRRLPRSGARIASSDPHDVVPRIPAGTGGAGNRRRERSAERHRYPAH